jgi:hypothetical protein
MVRLALLLSFALLGCEEGGGTAPAGGDQAGEEAAPPPELTFPPADPSDPLAVAIHGMAEQYARNMEPHGVISRGTLRTGEVRDHQAVLEGGRCYKVLAAGGPEATDLDLVLIDPNGVPLQQDSGTDARPVLGLTESICPMNGGAYRVQVRMYAGSGEYAMQVARTGPNLF